MKYINQLEHPHLLYITRTTMDGENLEFGKTSTVKTSGCGLCAALMAADRLLVNVNFGLTDAIQMSYDTRANHRIGTDYTRFLPAFAEKLGLKYVCSSDIRELRDCLRTGGVAVALVDGDRDGQIGLFTRTSHYITVISEETDGRLAILDPSWTPRKYTVEGRVGKVELKDEVIILCEGAILEEERARRQTPYYLFWRA